jgi:hypothetical protein
MYARFWQYSFSFDPSSSHMPMPSAPRYTSLPGGWRRRHFVQWFFSSLSWRKNLRQNSHTKRVSRKPFSSQYSAGSAEKYHVSMRWTPSCSVFTFFTFV